MNASEKYQTFPVTTPEEVKARDAWYQETFLMMDSQDRSELKNFMISTTELEFLQAYCDYRFALYNEIFEGAPL